MDLLHLLGGLGHVETIAFAATLLCVWMAAEGALRLPNRTPRIATAAMLFALNWALLLLFYLPGPPQNEILSAFAGFLLVNTGVLLLREAREGRAVAGWLDTLPLRLLRW